MRKTTFRLLALAVCAAAFGLLISCAADKPFSTEGLSAEELFQRAQDASDKGNNQLAIDYYAAVPEKFPDDTAHGIWATYEIAFLYRKMGKNQDALALIRIDRVADALAAGLSLTAGGLALRIADPDDLLTSPKQTVA